MSKYEDTINHLISNPHLLLKKKPFIRGLKAKYDTATQVEIGEDITVSLPNVVKQTISQEQFMRELDPSCHNVLFDENIPSICCKLNNGGYKEIVFQKMAVPFQKMIKDKQVLHLTGYHLNFTLLETNPSQKQQRDFITFKKYWDLRNQEGMKNKMVDTQKSYGDAGLLYYFDYLGRIKSRILSFADGYVLCPHNDDNGDRILESVYYCKDDVEYIDSYDATYMYRHEKNNGNVETAEPNTWVLTEKVPHGFQEIPLITKRGNVAWNNVQSIIESYETLFNVFNTIQKKFSWGILYVKGKFSDSAKKLAGNVILNDTSIDGNGDAKFLTPPSPQGTLETLKNLEEAIQKGSGSTFILPKDINMSGDISGIAIMLTQSRDIETAMQDVIDWQNVADKMVRLFKYGLSMELVSNGKHKTAITDFDNLNINAKFKVWKPMNDYEYNQMLTVMKSAGIISTETAIENNTESKPDEKERIKKEAEETKEVEVKEETTSVIMPEDGMFTNEVTANFDKDAIETTDI